MKPVKVAYTGTTVAAKDIQAALKKKETPQKLGDYKYKQLLLTLYGYTKGRAGTENKHELPPPHDTILAFGDILVIATAGNGKPATFKPEEYETFYTKMFGGFDDIDSEDSQSEDEEEEAAVEEEGVEEDEEGVVEDEEESEEEDEEEEGDDLPEGEEDFEGGEEIVPVRAPKVAKKKKVVPSLLVAQTGASQIIHVTKDELLTEEGAAALSPERQHSLRVLRNILGDINLSPEEIEIGVYKATLEDSRRRHVTCHWKNELFNHIYQTKIRQIIGNILPDSYVENKTLLNDLKSGKYSLEEACKFDSYKLSNDRWKDHFHRRQQQEKRQLEGNKAMATDQFLCTRCHKRECTYYEMQTRSADEPMTIFITCMNCGKHWRQ